MRPQTRMKTLPSQLLILSCMPGFALAQDVKGKTVLPPQDVITEAAGTAVMDAGDATRANDQVAVQRNLRLMYPKTRFGKISTTPLPGIYEVVMGRNVAFVEESGRYFIFGRMFDMEKQEDITSGAEGGHHLRSRGCAAGVTGCRFRLTPAATRDQERAWPGPADARRVLGSGLSVLQEAGAGAGESG